MFCAPIFSSKKKSCPHVCPKNYSLLKNFQTPITAHPTGYPELKKDQPLKDKMSYGPLSCCKDCLSGKILVLEKYGKKGKSGQAVGAVGSKMNILQQIFNLAHHISTKFSGNVLDMKSSD